MSRLLGAAAITAAAVACGALAAGPSGTAARGTSAGVYSAAQAEEGAQLYVQRCGMCHGKTLGGTAETPGLTGKFMANWGRRPVGDLFDYIGRAMPQFAPGSLSPEDDARLVAFLLRANGMPAGQAPLSADGAKLRALLMEPASPVK